MAAAAPATTERACAVPEPLRLKGDDKNVNIDRGEERTCQKAHRNLGRPIGVP